MKDYIKLFDNHTDYIDYINSPDLVLPNISLCKDESLIHYNDDNSLIIILNVTSTTNNTKLMSSSSKKALFSEMWIDGVKLPEVVHQYIFETTGEHIIKYKLVDSTTIGENAFYGCQHIKSVILSNKIETIGKLAFYSCESLTNIIFNTVSVIDIHAFNNCTSLTSIILPDSITQIKSNAFDFCINLSSITITRQTPPTIGSNVFTSLQALKIYVPADLLLTYKSAWTAYKSKIVAIS